MASEQSIQIGTAKPASTRAAADEVARVLVAAGHVAYLAGGCVRDHLLGREAKDFDVATDAPPDRVLSLFRHTQKVGLQFGVVLVHLGRSSEGGGTVEVATFRTDGEYRDGRRPESVTFTDAEHDARRRDFTINGLFLDPRTGDVIDYVGGRADLEARVIRAIGEPRERFAEDHLRLLRAIRFAARLDFTIEPNTLAAIVESADRLKGISPERIAEELRLILQPPTRAAAWRLLHETPLADEIFRHWPRATSRPRLKLFELMPATPIRFSLALAAAFVARSDAVDVRSCFDRQAVLPAVTAARKTLKLSNEDTDELREVLLSLASVTADAPPRLAAVKRFLARPTSEASRVLLRAISTRGELPNAAEREADFAEVEKTDVAPPPLLTGDDLVAAGWSPGPMFKRVLEEVYDEQLEGRVETQVEARRLGEHIRGRMRSDS